MENGDYCDQGADVKRRSTVEKDVAGFVVQMYPANKKHKDTMNLSLTRIVVLVLCIWKTKQKQGMKTIEKIDH